MGSVVQAGAKMNPARQPRSIRIAGIRPGDDREPRLVSYGVAAVEPGIFGLGPVPAVKQALARVGWRLGDIEPVEINEVFATIAMVVMRELGLPEDIVNVEGGPSHMAIRSGRRAQS